MVQNIIPNKLESQEIELIFEEIYYFDDVPCYCFSVYSKEESCIVGHLSLRTKTTYEESSLWGNMGYTIWPEFRGKRYAFKASKIAIEFAKICGMNQIYMTTDPSNIASIKTILNLGGCYLETIKVPEDSSLFQEEKCQFNQRYCLFI